MIIIALMVLWLAAVWLGAILYIAQDMTFDRLTSAVFGGFIIAIVGMLGIAVIGSLAGAL